MPLWEPSRRGPATIAVLTVILGLWPSRVLGAADEPDLSEFVPRDNSVKSAPASPSKPADPKPGGAKPGDAKPAETKTGDAKSTDNTQGRAMFDTLWKEYATRYVKRDAEYFAVPGYDPAFPSSRGITVEQVLDKHQGTQTLDRQGYSMPLRKVTLIQRAEAEAVAMPIPWVTPGQYGYVRSVFIEKILGPDQMLVRDIELVDATELKKEVELKKKSVTDSGDQNVIDRAYAERTKLADRQKEIAFRSPILLTGFPTENLTEKSRWLGPNAGSGKIGLQIAVVRAVTEVKSAGSGKSYKVPLRKFYEAVPAEKLKEGITKGEFEEMLAQRGLGVPAFVEMVETELRRDQKLAAARVVERIEGLRTHKPDEPAAQQRPLFQSPSRAEANGSRQR